MPNANTTKNAAQGLYWIVTLSSNHHPEQPVLTDRLQWIKGQQETGAGGFLHWQFCIALKKKARVGAVASLWPGSHCELTRSAAAEEYCCKEESRVPGTEFEEGEKVVSIFK